MAARRGEYDRAEWRVQCREFEKICTLPRSDIIGSCPRARGGCGSFRSCPLPTGSETGKPAPRRLRYAASAKPPALSAAPCRGRSSQTRGAAGIDRLCALRIAFGNMPTTQTPSVETLKKALVIAEQIKKLESELAGILGDNATPQAVETPREMKPRKKKRTVSAESRAKMAEAQRARWAKKKAV